MRSVCFARDRSKLAVHRADHQIEPRQHLVRQVEAAVFEDVHLDALEQGDAVEFAVEAVDLVALPRQPQRIEAVRHGEAARVLGDGEVFAAPAPCAASAISRRLLWPSVALVCACRSPLQVGKFHQLRQASGARRLDLAAVLAQFRRDVGQADRCGTPIPRSRRRCARRRGTRRIR